jgi:hypothetical protein
MEPDGEPAQDEPEEEEGEDPDDDEQPELLEEWGEWEDSASDAGVEPAGSFMRPPRPFWPCCCRLSIVCICNRAPACGITGAILYAAGAGGVCMLPPGFIGELRVPKFAREGLVPPREAGSDVPPSEVSSACAFKAALPSTGAGKAAPDIAARLAALARPCEEPGSPVGVDWSAACSGAGGAGVWKGWWLGFWA